ncbi:MAG: hypothetical protein E6I99_15640 [Chloroflexi bacterium]|nr:MAG: hypothetical protein E6I99_15640 [Chloroflexota bacterium]
MKSRAPTRGRRRSAAGRPDRSDRCARSAGSGQSAGPVCSAPEWEPAARERRYVFWPRYLLFFSVSSRWNFRCSSPLKSCVAQTGRRCRRNRPRRYSPLCRYPACASHAWPIDPCSVRRPARRVRNRTAESVSVGSPRHQPIPGRAARLAAGAWGNRPPVGSRRSRRNKPRDEATAALLGGQPARFDDFIERATRQHPSPGELLPGVHRRALGPVPLRLGRRLSVVLVDGRRAHRARREHLLRL